MRTYSEIFFYAARDDATRRGTAGAICSKPCFLGEIEPQGEAMDYLDDKTLILGSETSQGRQGTLHRVQCQS